MADDQKRCRCGSGKLEHDCCGASVSNIGDLRITKIKKLLDGSGPKLVRFLLENFSDDLMNEAFDEFVAWDESYSFDAEDPICAAFFPWLVFNWLPGISLDESASLPEDATLCELYMKLNREKIGTSELQVFHAANRKPFSFFEVDRIKGGKIEIIDLLTLENLKVVSSHELKYATPGDIVYAKSVEVDSNFHLVAMAPVVIPPEFKKKVVQLRYHLTKIGGGIDADKLSAFDVEIRETYFNLEESLLSYDEPIINENSDGQTLRPQKVVFNIDNPQEAFDILNEFAPANEPIEDILICAQRDDAGRLFSVSFPWTQKIPVSADNIVETMIGFIRIEGANLTVVVNSDKRAMAAQSDVSRLMGSRAQFQTRIVDINDEEYNFFSDLYTPLDMDDILDKEFDS